MRLYFFDELRYAYLSTLRRGKMSRSRWNLGPDTQPEVFQVFFIIVSESPANMREVVIKMHPHLASVPYISKTPEYIQPAGLLRRYKSALLEWASKFYGKFRETNLENCSLEERQIAEKMLSAYSTCQALGVKLNSVLEGGRENYHRTGNAGRRPSRANPRQ